MKFFCCFCFVFTAFTLNAEQVENPIRTKDAIVETMSKSGALIPASWTTYSNMKPAIPSDYVAFTFEDDFDQAETILWCRKEDIEILKKMDESSISKCPCFFVCHVRSAKIEEDDLDHIDEIYLDILKQAGFYNVKTQKVRFGDHLALVCEHIYDGVKGRIAYVGIDHGDTLQVMFSPVAENRETRKKYKEIWDAFISQTK